MDLSNWLVSDGVVFSFPVGVSIEADARIIVARDRDTFLANYNVEAASVYGNWVGSLSNGGERITLLRSDGQISDDLRYDDEIPFDPRPDGTGPSLERVCADADGSLPGNWLAGEIGGSPLEESAGETCPPPPAGVFSPVVITEVHYHPTTEDPFVEFVEIFNRSNEPVDLTGWRLADAVDYTFGENDDPTTLPPGAFWLLAQDPEAVHEEYAVESDRVLGPYQGRLSNYADDVQLETPEGVNADRVRYRQDGLWPAAADGLGSSLQRISTEVSGLLVQNWRASKSESCDSSESNCRLLENGSEVRWFENLDGTDPGFSGDLDWFHPDFDDAANSWQDGTLGVGYDTRAPDGQPWVQTRSTSQAGLHSILLRIEFNYDPAACAIDIPYLGVDRDDGFVAWLNGVEIARGGIDLPDGVVPPFDGTYNADVVQAGGIRQSDPVYETVWVGESGILRQGRNVLAIGNYNSRSTSSDLYLSARVTLGASGAVISPGQANGPPTSSVPPLVLSAEHQPAFPTSDDSVRIEARVDGGDILAVELVYDQGDGEQTASMRDDGLGGDTQSGDGLYTATLPPAADQTIVRYRVAAKSTDSCALHFPRAGNPSTWRGYYVFDGRPVVEDEVRVFSIFTPGALTDLTCTSGVRRPGTFVDFRGRVYFNVGVKFRGDTACNYPKRPMRVRFQKGDYLDGQQNVNFNAGWNDKAMLREKLGFDLFRDAGVAQSDTHLARVHTNNGAFHGAYFTVEDPDGNYLRRNDWDSNAALYKCRTAFLNGSTAGLEARTDAGIERIAEAGSFASDLNSFRGAALVDLLETKLNVESFIDYQAVQVILIDGDSVVKNWLLYLGKHGYGKTGEDRFACFAWDIDLSHGQMYLTQDVRHHNIHPLFQTSTYPFVGQGHHGIVSAVLERSNDYFTKAYYGRMWNILEEKFHPDVFLSKIDEYDAATIDTIRADLQRWTRTWGARGNDPSFWRENLKAWAERRYDYLRAYLLADNPTTGGRRFQYTPAPRVRFSEIHYHPAQDDFLEFVEIVNLERTSVDLEGWDIPAVEFTFPEGSRIPAGGFVIVARDPKILRSRTPIPDSVAVFGPYTGALSNAGEELRLRDNGMLDGVQYYPETIDVVPFDDEGAWPQEADGEGFSLELRDPGLDNDLPTSWSVSTELGGTPGRVFIGISPSEGLVSYWPFDESASDVANDFSAGTGVANDDLNAQGGDLRFAPGLFGGALAIGDQAGDPQWLYAPDSDDVHLGAVYSIEAWIHPTVLEGEWHRLVLSWELATRYHFALRFVDGAWTVSLFHQQSDGTIVNADGGNVIEGAWQHIAGIADGKTLSVYLNGTQVMSTPYDGTINATRSSGLGLGDQFGGAGSRYRGLVDELAIWNVALTPEQVSAHYTTESAAYGLVPASCDEVPDQLRITGPSGAMIGEAVTLSAELEGIDDGQVPSYRWELLDGTAELGATDEETLSVRSNEAGVVRVRVTAGDGLCDDDLIAEHSISFLDGDPQSPSEGLIAYYPFENSTDDEADLFENGSGSVFDGLTPHGVDPPRYVEGVVGSAVAIGVDPGDALWLDAPNSADLRLPSRYSIECWINPTELTDSWQRLVVRWGTQQSYHFAIRNNGTNQNGEQNINAVSLFHLQDDGTTVNVEGGTVTLNEWQHIAGVADGERLIVYLNGEEVGRLAYNDTIHPAPGQGLGLGDFFGGNGLRYNGLVDELAIWNVPLNAAEIESHYLAGPIGYGLGRGCEEERDIVRIEGLTTSTVGDATPLSAVFEGNDGNVNYSWRLLEGDADIGATDKAELSLTPNTVGTIRVEVSANDSTCDNVVRAEHSITVFEGGQGLSPSEGLVSYWSFDGELADSASAFDAGTGEADDHFNARGGDARFVPGVLGDALALGVSGSDAQWLDAVDSADVDLGPIYTIESWIYPTELTDSWQRIVLRWGTSGLAYHFAIRNNGTNLGGEPLVNSVSLFHGEAGGGQPNANGGTVVENQWQHIAGVADGEMLRVYLDGVEVDAVPYDGTIARGIGEGLGLGDSFSALSGIKYNGLIDEVAIWNVALTERELLSHALAGPNGYGLDGVGPPEPTFHRGDVNDDGALNLTDAISILSFLFLGGTPPNCQEAADTNDDGAVNLTDAISVLGFLFLGGAPLPDPGPPLTPCGPDRDGSPANLGCESYTSC
ncbi:MAG: LamG-like jellyroll fold domain-containing protein [Planctomycetota bacterium]